MFIDADAVSLRIKNWIYYNWETCLTGQQTGPETMGLLLDVATGAVVDEFNLQFSKMLDNADTQLLERAAVMLAERVALRGDR